MSKRLTTRGLSELLSAQLGWDKSRAEKFINVLSSYIAQTLDKNKNVKVIGLGTFKVVLVRERESVHIKTGERFVIPAHHKLSFIPDKDFKEHINRPFAFLEPIETDDEGVSSADNNSVTDEISEKEGEEVPVVVIDDDESPSVEAPIEETSSDEIKEDDALESEEVLEDEDDDEDDTEEEISEDEVDEDNSEDEEEDSDVAETEETEEEPVVAEVFEEEQEEPAEKDTIGAAAQAEPMPFVGEIPSNAEKTQNPETVRKRKTHQAWIMYILIPLVVLIGTIIATYAFLYYNTPDFLRGARNNNTAAISSTLIQSPLPIGEIPSDSISSTTSNNIDNTDSVSISSDTTSLVSDTSAQNAKAEIDTVKKEETHAIDWLAPARNVEETKRADKPNPEIERNNAKLGKNNKNENTATASTDKPKQATAAASDRDKDKTAASNDKPKTTENKPKTMPARVRMTAGSSLTQIAMEHYGDKVFWVYIYEYNKNRISDFNNIPVGTELRLPSPKTYGIDAKNKSSIAKAREKQSKLLKWDNWDDYK